ncbi:hypothetical protein ACWM35_17365 [Neobacillus sp. K501]
MKKWAISAIVYLLVVIGGYLIYDEFIKKDEPIASHSEEKNHETAEVSEEAHGHDDGEESAAGGVMTTFTYDDGKISITIKDGNGKSVNELEINHEKLLHLIVVNENLDQYYHLHPEKVGEGQFEVADHRLQDGAYKAFIDIKPKNLNYEVSPVAFQVGEGSHESHGHATLTADQELIQTIDGETVEMNISSLESGKDVTLSFQLDEGKLEQYLGAAGHVVILDEQADKYLHVHPLNESMPVFETHFDQPGRYKIWAEFKQDGKVRVFPFVIEIP